MYSYLNSRSLTGSIKKNKIERKKEKNHTVKGKKIALDVVEKIFSRLSLHENES